MTLSTLEKENEDYMTERLSIFKALKTMLVTPQPLQIAQSQSGKSDLQCKMKETLLIRDLKPALNENVGSEKLCLFLFWPEVISFGFKIIHLFSLLPLPHCRFFSFF